jgi:phosphate transport system substrate-binding protein
MSNAQRKHFQCRHIFADGHRCGSKCLREENFCYYHYRSHKPRLLPEQYSDKLSTFELPAFEDRSAIQSAITLIAQRIAAGNLDSKRAGLLLYALQIASLNLPKPSAEPLESVDEVELDESGAMIAPTCEYAAKPHEKTLEEIVMEQWHKDEDEEIARKAAKTLAELKRQAAAESFTLPARYAVAEPDSERISHPCSQPTHGRPSGKSQDLHICFSSSTTAMRNSLSKREASSRMPLQTKNVLSSSIQSPFIPRNYRSSVQRNRQVQPANPIGAKPIPMPAHLDHRKTLAILCATLSLAAAAAAQARPHVDPSLPDYKPQPVSKPSGHGWVMPDGSVRIVGFDDMAGMVGKWDQEFSATHPGIKFTPELKGNGTAIAAITYDMAAFAPEGGGATLLELLPYEKIYGSKKEPIAALIIRVAHGSLNPAARMSPLGIVVNKSNPIKSLTKEQVATIFSTGSGTGDITNWTQIGMTGELADKPIHPTGLYWDAYQRPEDPNAGEYMMYRQFGHFPGFVFSPNYEQFMHYSDVVKQVASDPLAIGIVALNKVDSTVRVVPLVEADGHTLSTGSAADLTNDKYPYPRDLYIYIRREPGTPFDPFVQEYMRMILSKQGQQAVADDPKGYLPLTADEVKAELERLDAAQTWGPRSKQGPKLNFPFPSPEPEGK